MYEPSNLLLVFLYFLVLPLPLPELLPLTVVYQLLFGSLHLALAQPSPATLAPPLTTALLVALLLNYLDSLLFLHAVAHSPPAI